jgi:hypothetical protein
MPEPTPQSNQSRSRKLSSHTNSDMTSKLWDIANYITGFSVAQALFFAVAFGSNEEMRAALLQYGQVPMVIFVLIVIFTIFYCLAICWCHRRMNFSNNERRIARGVKRGQLITIIVFNCVMISPIVGITFHVGPVLCQKSTTQSTQP